MTMCTCNAQLLPHDPIKGVCPTTFYGMPLDEWRRHGALPTKCDPEKGTHSSPHKGCILR